MKRARDPQAQRIERASDPFEELRASRRELKRTFDSMMMERRALTADFKKMTKASRDRRHRPLD